jgi:hypothetical protein
VFSLFSSPLLLFAQIYLTNLCRHVNNIVDLCLGNVNIETNDKVNNYLLDEFQVICCINKFIDV